MTCANHPERESISFCQNCGKPLCSECARTVGTGVFCEPCLAARLTSAPPPPVDYGTVYGTVPPSASAPLGASNPVLAGALGFIPGVGAMYNGQYAKGVVHLIVFTVLVSLTDRIPPLGMLIAGWVFYQVFEAYHTARAIREGTPLPNPFGLNDIGERFGFGKAWPSGTAAQPARFTAAPSAGAAQPVSFAQDAAGNTSFSWSNGAQFAQTPGGTQSYQAEGAVPPPAAWGAPAESYGYTTPPFAPTPPMGMAAPYQPPAVDQNRFPMGAVILIGLGLLFFFGSTGWFHGFPVYRVIPFFLIGLGVWLFVRKMLRTGTTLSDDGNPNYQYRIFCALRGSVWVVLVGVLFLLNDSGVLDWGHSWPLFIILAGVMLLLQRAIGQPTPIPAYGYAAASPVTAPVQPSPAPPTDSVETSAVSHPEERS